MNQPERIYDVVTQFRAGNFLCTFWGGGVVSVKAINQKDSCIEGLYQLHSSCKSYCSDPTTLSEKVSYAYLSGEHICDYDVVDVHLVKSFVEAVEK